MEKLEWREVAGFPGCHVNQLGHVRNGRGVVLQHRMHAGRMVVHVGTRMLPVARAVARAFLSTPSPGAHVGFRDGRRSNPVLSNLYWRDARYCDPKDPHESVPGVPRGVHYGGVSQELRDAIRADESGLSYRAMGAKYGVTHACIYYHRKKALKEAAHA